jgi:hypothetical protein
MTRREKYLATQIAQNLYTVFDDNIDVAQVAHKRQARNAQTKNTLQGLLFRPPTLHPSSSLVSTPLIWHDSLTTPSSSQG